MARCRENAGRAVSLFPNVPSVRSLTPSQQFLVHHNPVRPLSDILHDGDRLQRPAVQQSMTACVTGTLPPRPLGLDEAARAPSRRVERRDPDMLARSIEWPFEEEGEIFGDKTEFFLFLVFRRPPKEFQGSRK